MNCAHRERSPCTQSGADGKMCHIERTNTGRLNAAPIQNLRVMSANSVFSSSLSAGVFRLQRHPANRAIPGMILLDLRVHRAGVDNLLRSVEGRIPFQRHAAVRTTARHIALYPFAHRAKVFLCWLTRLGRCYGHLGIVMPAAATGIRAAIKWSITFHANTVRRRKFVANATAAAAKLSGPKARLTGFWLACRSRQTASVDRTVREEHFLQLAPPYQNRPR